GLSGTPDRGHCSRAATRASWPASSARPTSRRIRAAPATMRADSIRQTASMVRRVRSCSDEVGILEHLTDLELGPAVKQWRSLDPLDGLFFRRGLDQPEAGDELLRLGERAVDDGPG